MEDFVGFSARNIKERKVASMQNGRWIELLPDISKLSVKQRLSRNFKEVDWSNDLLELLYWYKVGFLCKIVGIVSGVRWNNI